MSNGPTRLEPLISSEQISERVRTLAEEIAREYAGESVLLVGVLKGAFVFLADLARTLELPLEIDFLQVASYGDATTSSGVVQIRRDLDSSVEGRHVLLVEDIVDTGATIDHLRQLFAVRNPRSVRVVSLLSKPEARKLDTPVEYVGFDIPNEFVVGYGLDYAERYRNLPYVAILRGE